MKYLFLIVILLPNVFFSQLVEKNEKVLFSFQTTNNKRMVLVTDHHNSYLQYRFGNNNKIEMVFPKDRTKESWRFFHYNSYLRGGGIGNAGQEIDNLAFSNNEVQYTIYRAYFSEGKSFSTGILVQKNKKQTRITGKYKTIKGSISNVAEVGGLKIEDIGLEF